MKLERVIWMDAGSDDEDSGWLKPEHIEDTDILVQSVGWIAKETDKYLTLAMDLCSDGSTNTRGRIPKGMIVDRKVLFDTTEGEK